ncbi:unnamed protein product, partial [Prorocentrum cordatum]
GSAAATFAEARLRGLRLQLEAAGEGIHQLAFADEEGLYGLVAAEMVSMTPEQACRLQCAVLRLGGQRASHIAQVYDYADGAAAVEDNEALLLAALSWFRSLGDVPALLVGDLNLVLHGTSAEPSERWLVVSAGPRWDLGLATYAALKVELAIEAPQHAAMRWRPLVRLRGLLWIDGPTPARP